jgi:hypothetical protein
MLQKFVFKYDMCVSKLKPTQFCTKKEQYEHQKLVFDIVQRDIFVPLQVFID